MGAKGRIFLVRRAEDDGKLSEAVPLERSRKAAEHGREIAARLTPVRRKVESAQRRVLDDGRQRHLTPAAVQQRLGAEQHLQPHVVGSLGLHGRCLTQLGNGLRQPRLSGGIGLNFRHAVLRQD
eukprot:7041820-Prymnesium_polylepis.1